MTIFSYATWKDNEFKFVCFNREQTIGSIVYVTEIFKYTGPLIVLQSENTLQSLIKFTVKPIKQSEKKYKLQ